MRCDANVSIMLKGSKIYGKKVEVKNMNSIRNVQRAIDFEIERQIEEIEKGNLIVSETRQFDATTGSTYSMRTKEELNDYRYFPEPDLQPLHVSEVYLNNIKASLPSLPQELYDKFVKQFGLSAYDAQVLTDSKEIALFFEDLCKQTKNYKAASNWVMGPVKSYLNELTLHINKFPISTQALADIIALIDSGKVSFAVASQKVFPAMLEGNKNSPLKIAESMNLIQESNTGSLQPIIDEVLAGNPAKVAEYKGGKTGLLAMFMGEVMKKSKGKADPKITSELLKKSLEN
jgi:aspartyl-tRNA(Asn)/glutamyl-tRNA(Gln) amidotransferase subunit B